MGIDNSKALPYGLRDVKLRALSADQTTTVGGAVDLPASRTLTFSESVSNNELRGDDRVVASRSSDPMVDWSLEAGGISLECYAIMAGGLVSSSGVTPNVIKRYRKLVTDNRPYFKIEGQSINDNGGDFHAIIYRARADGSLDGDLGDNEFRLTSASGKGYASLEAATLDCVYDFIHNETAVAIAGGNNEIQVIVLDATGGTFTVTFGANTTAALTANTLTAAILQTALTGLASIGAGNATVTSNVSSGAGIYTVTFTGTLANTNTAQMTMNVASLTGGSAAIYTANQGG